MTAEQDSRSTGGPRLEAESDEVLAGRVQRGDADALERLVRRYVRAVHAVAASYLAEPEDIEDAAQETFLRAIRGIALYDVKRPFAPWLYQIARNVARLVDGPKSTRYKIQPLTPEQARALLGAVRGHRLEALYRLALSLGLRKGEVLGLAWSDIDFARETLTVRRTLQRLNGKLVLSEPKSEAGIRTLALPAILVTASGSKRSFPKKKMERGTPTIITSGRPTCAAVAIASCLASARCVRAIAARRGTISASFSTRLPVARPASRRIDSCSAASAT